MKDLFTSEQVNVQQAQDIVQLILGTNKIRLYYQSTFTICSKLQGASKIAMQHEGVKPEFWNEIAKYDRNSIDTPIHRTYRRSPHQANVQVVDIDIEGSLVVVKFDDLVAKFHYTDAAKLCVWLRRAAKQAKNWSGDRSRIWNTWAHLTDAEAEDKINYA